MEKTVLVTGGSQGLGAAIVEVLAEREYRVMAGDIQEEKVVEKVKEWKRKGLEVEPIRMDVADEKSVRGAVEAVVKKWRRLDVVVNNAGVDVTKPVSELSLEEWDRVMGVNLRGPFVVSKVAMEVMQGGNIVNVASTAAKRGWPNASVYHASKWGLIGFSRGLFTEAREVGIKVTVVIAGGMRTPFILDRFPEVSLDKLQEPRVVAEMIAAVLEVDAESVVPELMVLPLKETSWP